MNKEYKINPIITNYLVNYMKDFLDNKINFFQNSKLLHNSGLLFDGNNKKPPSGTPLAIILAGATLFILISKKI